MPPPDRADLGLFAHGQFSVDYEARPDLQVLREKRVTRAREAMITNKLDALLCWQDENVRYLTGLPLDWPELARDGVGIGGVLWSGGCRACRRNGASSPPE